MDQALGAERGCQRKCCGCDVGDRSGRMNLSLQGTSGKGHLVIKMKRVECGEFEGGKWFAGELRRAWWGPRWSDGWGLLSWP